MKRLPWGKILAISLIVFVEVLPTQVLAVDERCHQLEALNAQYAGVALTADQKQTKRKMVAWYYGNCRGHHGPRLAHRR
jgi:hypothetical protein